MYDYAEVTKVPVKVSVPSQEVRRLVMQRMDVMQRELQHAQRGLAALRQALMAPAATSRPFADAVMNSRNWLVSAVASYTYIQGMLETDNPKTNALNQLADRTVDTCFRLAAATGYNLALQWRLGVRVDHWKDFKST